MYKLLPQFDTSTPHTPISEPTNFFSEAVFAADSFLDLEAAFGRVNGVIKTATGYCGGTFKKPTYKEVCEGITGHTEAVKVYYDKQKISYKSLCDIFWETHDPTNKNYLNFGLSTHQRSAIYYINEEERKLAQESRIRKQMKLNKRIVTKIIQFDSEFYMAENRFQKHYLQKRCWVCESLSLRSTVQFVESSNACKLNGILAMDESSIIKELKRFITSNGELPERTKLALEEIIEDIRTIQ